MVEGLTTSKYLILAHICSVKVHFMCIFIWKCFIIFQRFLVIRSRPNHYFYTKSIQYPVRTKKGVIEIIHFETVNFVCLKYFKFQLVFFTDYLINFNFVLNTDKPALRTTSTRKDHLFSNFGLQRSIHIAAYLCF